MGYDLVAAVNALRASQGLEPYQIDPWLMAYAQEHAEYMASIHSGTHQHSDGTLPQAIGLQENVASGDAGVVTVNRVVYEIWVDWGHRHIMDGYSTGAIGAGVAVSDDGQVYYTINIRPGENAVSVTPVPGTPLSFIPLATSLPGEDGSITHTVGYGQTLWSIAVAYGVTIDEIRRLNGIAGDSTVIYVGQELIIRQADPNLPTPPVATLITSAPTLFETIPIIIETATSTPLPRPDKSPTSTPDIPPAVQLMNKTVSTIFFTISVAGLLTAIFFGFQKIRKTEPSDEKKED